jgi:hypothetical protein
LGPEQQVTISYLYPASLSLAEINTYVKSDMGSTKMLEVLPLSPYPIWLSFLAVQLLEMIPITVLVYWAMVGIRA